MTHIATTATAETSMRGLYKLATSNKPVIAEQSHVDTVYKIIDLTRQEDLLKLEISKLKGSLMGFMQGHSALADGSGRTLVLWTNGPTKKVIDYQALFDDFNITPEILEKYTTKVPGTRAFNIQDT